MTRHSEQRSATINTRQKRLFYSTIIIGVCLIIVANSALWAYRYFFNTQRFSDTITSAITTERSREAIATTISDNIFENRPIAERLIGDQTTKLITGLLGSSQFENSFTTVAQKVQSYLTTTADREDISFNISGAKSIINSVANITSATRIDDINETTSELPDEIVLIESDAVPNLYTYGIALLWIGPIMFIGAIVAFLYPHLALRRFSYKLYMQQSIALLLGGCIALLIGPLFKPLVLSQIDNFNSRVVAEEMYNAFIGAFNQQTLLIILIALLGSAAVTLIHYFPALRRVERQLLHNVERKKVA